MSVTSPLRQQHRILTAHERLVAAEAELASAAMAVLRAVAAEATYTDGATALMVSWPGPMPDVELVGGGPPRPVLTGRIATTDLGDEIDLVDLLYRAVHHLPHRRSVIQGAGW